MRSGLAAGSPGFTRLDAFSKFLRDCSEVHVVLPAARGCRRNARTGLTWHTTHRAWVGRASRSDDDEHVAALREEGLEPGLSSRVERPAPRGRLLRERRTGCREAPLGAFEEYTQGVAVFRLADQLFHGHQERHHESPLGSFDDDRGGGLPRRVAQRRRAAKSGGDADYRYMDTRWLQPAIHSRYL